MPDNTKFNLRRFYIMLMLGTGLVWIGLMLLILFKNSQPSSGTLSAVPVEVDLPAPQLTLIDPAGNNVSLEDHLGSVVLVNLWATWCAPCKQEMPALETFYRQYRLDGFVVIGIDQEESLEVVAPFVEDFGLTFPVWLDQERQAEEAFNTVGLPSSYVIDRNGRIRLVWVGGISKRNLEKYVSGLIEE